MAQIKTYDQRQEQILNLARQLFYTQGYENTSVQNIIDTVQIAKGTFYHYFKSKDELLEAMLQRETETILQALQETIQNPELNALEKLNALFKQAGLKKAESKETIILLARMFASPSNLKLRINSQRMVGERIQSLYSEIIAQGIQEKRFQTISAAGAAELILSLHFGLSDRLLDLFLESLENPEVIPQLESKVHHYEYAIERILGLKAGSIQLLDRDILNLFWEPELSSHEVQP